MTSHSNGRESWVACAINKEHHTTVIHCAPGLKRVTGRYECSENLLDHKKPLKFITPLDVSFQKKDQRRVIFYDSRDLNIAKSKISKQYIRSKFEIVIRLFDGQLDVT